MHQVRREGREENGPLTKKEKEKRYWTYILQQRYSSRGVLRGGCSQQFLFAAKKRRKKGKKNEARNQTRGVKSCLLFPQIKKKKRKVEKKDWNKRERIA